MFCYSGVMLCLLYLIIQGGLIGLSLFLEVFRELRGFLKVVRVVLLLFFSPSNFNKCGCLEFFSSMRTVFMFICFVISFLCWPSTIYFLQKKLETLFIFQRGKHFVCLACIASHRILFDLAFSLIILKDAATAKLFDMLIVYSGTQNLRSLTDVQIH